MTTFYDLSIGSYKQAIDGMITVMNKGAEFAAENNLDPDNFVKARLHENMLPLLFQVNCVEVHTLGALSGIESGVFTPPSTTEQRDYSGLQAMLIQTKSELETLDPSHVENLSGKSMIFKFKDYELPFTAENFVMSFSLPNLYFHTTTAYDILRHNGVPLGKADFLGRMRIGV
ncbi:hypothetical protein GCM10008090_08070 [Arenicella chitinivorans]|uniref:DUF1993 domain-containing protein n=1 Tax=Arenicella chitinivorans TaxID=1329800 RepID=A0A918RK94_9GAMM|nr:DUF1993 domain-containing protein [Arenicella chitinivorans]GHA01324.1 hypothetical protein GCM10008090_08070 [Arenicella chitinivorans]